MSETKITIMALAPGTVSACGVKKNYTAGDCFTVQNLYVAMRLVEQSRGTLNVKGIPGKRDYGNIVPEAPSADFRKWLHQGGPPEVIRLYQGEALGYLERLEEASPIPFSEVETVVTVFSFNEDIVRIGKEILSKSKVELGVTYPMDDEPKEEEASKPPAKKRTARKKPPAKPKATEEKPAEEEDNKKEE